MDTVITAATMVTTTHMVSILDMTNHGLTMPYTDMIMIIMASGLHLMDMTATDGIMITEIMADKDGTMMMLTSGVMQQMKIC